MLSGVKKKRIWSQVRPKPHQHHNCGRRHSGHEMRNLPKEGAMSVGGVVEVWLWKEEGTMSGVEGHIYHEEGGKVREKVRENNKKIISLTRVDGGLSCSDGHVGCVGDERGALHDGLLLAVHFDGEL
jgi:hypothetical protein